MQFKTTHKPQNKRKRWLQAKKSKFYRKRWAKWTVYIKAVRESRSIYEPLTVHLSRAYISLLKCVKVGDSRLKWKLAACLHVNILTVHAHKLCTAFWYFFIHLQDLKFSSSELLWLGMLYCDNRDFEYLLSLKIFIAITLQPEYSKVIYTGAFTRDNLLDRFRYKNVRIANFSLAKSLRFVNDI